MIPKVIHYCWFGCNKKSELIKRCIRSWKKFCPDYEIKKWSESNFNIKCCDYVNEAYESKKWAYVRLFALVNEGGIYLDTDVEVLSILDKFLDIDVFSEFEIEKWVPTEIMGCRKDNKLFSMFLKNYDNRHFILKNNKYDLTTNVETITKLCLNKRLILNNGYQIIEGFALCPSDYFYPENNQTGIITLIENSHILHYFNGSWVSKRLSENYKIVLVGTNENINKLLPSKIISIHRTQNPKKFAEIYTMADLFVNSTIEENFPTVNIEALACGTSVLTFRTGGSPEVIDESCGIVVDCDDINNMENKILRIYKERSYSQDLCVKRGEKFDMNKKIDEYIDLFKSTNMRVNYDKK